MLLIDDLFAAPVKGVFWIFKKIYGATMDELDRQQDLSRSALTELYMQLETGRISEKEFDSREKQLLEQLDKVEALKREASRSQPQPGGAAKGGR